MKYPHKVYLLVLSGNVEECRKRMASRYPGCEIVPLSKRLLREGGWKTVAQELWKLRGEAFIVCADNHTRLEQSKFITALGLFHRCRRTVLDDSSDYVRAFGRWQLTLQLPKLGLALLADGATLLAWWIMLHIFKQGWSRPAAKIRSRDRVCGLDVAVLYPFPLQETAPGGEMSYLKGLLSGLAAESVSCEIFSGCPLPFDIFPTYIIPNRRRFYFFPESQALSYNLRFFWETLKRLRRRRPRFLYQRHGRFVVAGIMISRLLRIPLVLEYQCSEVWRAKHWDPVHFHDWLRRCEDASIGASSRIVALSDVLRDELLECGVATENIVLNPAAVDPQTFHPGRGPEERGSLGYDVENVVVGFVGSFSYWHGIVVLQQAIGILLDRSRKKTSLRNLRFLLVGDGLLWPEISTALRSLKDSEAITFTGRVPHQRIPGLLDACDILVCAHIPPADGTRFFGSPSKLFEYMAMGKGIVASDLDQLAEVLQHQVTAWLVPPEDAEELANAIELLAVDSELRQRMGQKARTTALNLYTWRHNAARLLLQFPVQPGCGLQPGILDTPQLVQSPRGGGRV